MFEFEKEFLKPLPTDPYQVATHCKARLHPDCHLAFDKNFYSAPYQHRGKEIDVWATVNCIEIYYQCERIAFHKRGKSRGKFITDIQHYPTEHQAYLEISPQNILAQAERIGEFTTSFIKLLFTKSHPLRYLRTAQGIISLQKRFDVLQLEAACKQAINLNQIRYRFVEQVLKRGMIKMKQPQMKIERGINPFLRQEELF